MLGPALRGRVEVAGSRFRAAWLAVRPRMRRGTPADTSTARSTSPGQEDWHALSSVPIGIELATPSHQSRAAELLRRRVGLSVSACGLVTEVYI